MFSVILNLPSLPPEKKNPLKTQSDARGKTDKGDSKSEVMSAVGGANKPAPGSAEEVRPLSIRFSYCVRNNIHRNLDFQFYDCF